MPFPAAVLGAFELDDDALVRVFYAASLTLVSIVITVVWIYAQRRGPLRPATTSAKANEVTAGPLTTDAVFVVSITAAYFSFLAAVFVLGGADAGRPPAHGVNGLPPPGLIGQRNHLRAAALSPTGLAAANSLSGMPRSKPPRRDPNGPNTPRPGPGADLPAQFARLVGGSTPAETLQLLNSMIWSNPFQRAQPVPSRRRPPRDKAMKYRIRIDLNGAKPAIWRRIEVTSDLTLDRLHSVLQVVMGWNDSHLHEFISGKNAIDRHAEHYRPQSSIDEELPGIEESSVRLDEVLVDPGDRLFYCYDFGDDWTHTLRLEAVEQRGDGRPVAVCLAGARACPPDDSGGVWGYHDLLTARGDSGNPQLLQWVGPDFDRAHFDVDQVNAALRGLDSDNQVKESLARVVDPTSRLGELISRLDELPEDLGRAVAAALEPVPEPDSETKAAMLRVYQLLLDQVGDAGISLTQAGYLPPRHVEALAEILRAGDFWPGTSNRETHTFPVLEFRETSQRLGLLRKAHNKLTLTKAGDKARTNVDALWKLVTGALPLGLNTRGAEVRASRDAGLLLLIAVGAALPEAERKALLSAGLAALGWHTDQFELLDDHDIVELVRPTASVLKHIGAIPRWTFHNVTPAEPAPADAVKAFAQAALRR